jgi:hypothetical protein
VAESPLDYLMRPFTETWFPDLVWPVAIAALALLVIQVVLYNVRSRQLHRHEPLVTLQEWLLWTGLSTFSLLLIEAIFHFYFLFVLLTIVIGVAVYLWIRFVRFPPIIEAYNAQRRRARFYTQQRFRHPEATVRQRRQERRRRKR